MGVARTGWLGGLVVCVVCLGAGFGAGCVTPMTLLAPGGGQPSTPRVSADALAAISADAAVSNAPPAVRSPRSILPGPAKPQAADSSIPALARPQAAESPPPVGPAVRPPQAQARAAEPTVADGLREVQRLCDRAEASFRNTESFIARLRCRELVNGVQRPMETLLFKYRKTPLSVHMKWIGEVGKGREVLFVEGANDGKMMIRTAAGDIPLVQPGKVLSINPDSPLVTAKSRHSIRESGFAPSIRKLREALQGSNGEPPPRYLGWLNRPELPEPFEAVEITIAPRRERWLDDGGRRIMGFDPENGLPTYVVTYDSTGRESEFYVFDCFQSPVPLDDRDFDPEALWGKR
jgi:hypothetical protein